MTPRVLYRARAGGRDGRLFTLCHVPDGPPRGVVVAVHPFAEELNKSRRNMAMGARALARAGHLVVTTDLAGCGDSDGELDSVTWSEWVEDTVDAVAWARAQAGDVPAWLWGVRAGCLVAAEASCGIDGDLRLLFWHPQTSGRQALQQFLRLKMAGLLNQGAPKGLTEALQAELAAGRPVEVAGYLLGPGVANGLASAQCGTPPARPATEVVWIDVSPQDPPVQTPASATAISRWRQAGFVVRDAVVAGPQFWQSAWLEEAPALAPRTAELLGETVTAADA